MKATRRTIIVRRLVLLLLLAISAGAVVNVAVASAVPPLVIGARWHYGWPVYCMGNVHHEVQLWIDWPGFAINTVFYAGVLWMLFAAPGMIRRRRRIKRGLCPACAYPVGVSEVCSECGKRVKGALT